ncbi:MAG: adenylyl-sulfate kinase [Gammaproteobacteria bacterium]|nr:adenylyl-sulfate kinase [Gammaproteobacteria bacterium]
MPVKKSRNITRVAHQVSTAEREVRYKHTGGVLWFTGLSGSGKSTLAFALEERLFKAGYQVYVLDGDNIRHGLNSDLGFSHEDRSENIRRVGEVAALVADAGILCISAFISPYRADRQKARLAAGGRFHEVYIQADVETCEQRDPKGLYKKARRGEIPNFTGITDPYEVPDHPELTIDTVENSVDACISTLAAYVGRQFELR